MVRENKWTTISISIPASVKAEFKAVCRAHGVSMAKAIRLFLYQTIQEGKLPFKYNDTSHLLSSVKNTKRLLASIEDVKKGNLSVKEFNDDADKQILVDKAVQIEATAEFASKEEVEKFMNR